MLKIQLCIMRINYISKYIQVENSCFKFHNNPVCACMFDQPNADFVSISDFFQKH